MTLENFRQLYLLGQLYPNRPTFVNIANLSTVGIHLTQAVEENAWVDFVSGNAKNFGISCFSVTMQDKFIAYIDVQEFTSLTSQSWELRRHSWA